MELFNAFGDVGGFDGVVGRLEATVDGEVRAWAWVVVGMGGCGRGWLSFSARPSPLRDLLRLACATPGMVPLRDCMTA